MRVEGARVRAAGARAGVETAVETAMAPTAEAARGRRAAPGSPRSRRHLVQLNWRDLDPLSWRHPV